MDNETLRQKEIERLNLIINLLIEKNHELELKLRSLSPEYISSKQPVLLNHEDLSDVNGLHYSTLLQNEQVNGVIYNHAEKTNAQNSAAYSNVEERRQSNEPAYSNVEERRQSNEPVYSNVKELQQSNHVTNPPLPQQIDVNKVKMPDVYRALHKRMPHAKRTAAHHAAVMLVHLYKKQENIHQELSKVAGLTPRGTAKHIMMLKRRGYIVRTSYQQYQLTETALNILREAMRITAITGHSDTAKHLRRGHMVLPKTYERS